LERESLERRGEERRARGERKLNSTPVRLLGFWGTGRRAFKEDI